MEKKNCKQESLEKKSDHVCNPHATTFYGIVLYQCGCGRYFTEKDLIKHGKGKEKDYK